MSCYFADGREVVPSSIRPALELVEAETWQSNLFRLASLTWSVPVSHGYGRRLRFLVWDLSNNKLVGLLGLGDPVFNLRVRDAHIGWSVSQRERLLVNVMDAFVLGAVPPYNSLLSGKLVASLIRTQEVRDVFAQKYGKSTGTISGKQKGARLVAVTTSSALGRSSLYNRLSLGGVKYLCPLGFSKGWGHFHVPESVFKLMRAYLEEIGHPYASGNRFGQGPNWRLRVIREAMSRLQINPNLLRHGVRRQVFISELASNMARYLTGKVVRPQFKSLLSVDEVSSLALKRWILPRAERNSDFIDWRKEMVLEMLREPAKGLPLRSLAKGALNGAC